MSATNMDMLLGTLDEFKYFLNNQHNTELTEDLLSDINDLIACPSEEICAYDGGNNHDCCAMCKAKWLVKEYE